MSTVFSHIVQKHLSQKNENVATEALAFILQSHESARSGLNKFLRCVAPNLPPSLRFRTQQTDDNARPDMWGYDGNEARVLIENKFWAGLTDNQPVQYLKLLAKVPKPSVLLVVVPEARQETVWRELHRRVVEGKLLIAGQDGVSSNVRTMTIEGGRILALTSWKTILDAIGKELTSESQAGKDVEQLRALCDSADNQSFLPIAAAEVTNQRTPAFLLQLNSIREGAVDKAIAAGALSIKNPSTNKPKQGQLLPQSSWIRFGRYVCFPGASGVRNCGGWIGTELTLWKDHGATPLWLVFLEFQGGEWYGGSDVRVVLETWADLKSIPTAWRRNKDGDDEFAIGIMLATGEEEEAVIASVVNQLRAIADELSKLGQKRNIK